MGGQNQQLCLQSESKSRGNWRGQRAVDHLTHSRVTSVQQGNRIVMRCDVMVMVNDEVDESGEEISGPAARVLC